MHGICRISHTLYMFPYTFSESQWRTHINVCALKGYNYALWNPQENYYQENNRTASRACFYRHNFGLRLKGGGICEQTRPRKSIWHGTLTEFSISSPEAYDSLVTFLRDARLRKIRLDEVVKRLSHRKLRPVHIRIEPLYTLYRPVIRRNIPRYISRRDIIWVRSTRGERSVSSTVPSPRWSASQR